MFGTEAQTELDDLKVVATKSGGRMKYIERIPWKAVRLPPSTTAPAQARARGPAIGDLGALGFGTYPATTAYRV
jgi:hypothetical protein